MEIITPFLNRVKKNYKHIRRWVTSRGIDAFRVYERDLPEFPLIIDVYGDWVLVFEQDKSPTLDDTGSKSWESIKIPLAEILGIDSAQVIVKVRERKSGTSQYERLSHQSIESIIEENGFRFHVNLTDYIDTGIFLDHRPLRERMLEVAKGKKMLNLFSYTATISVYAASVGAQCTNIDLSNTYQNWAQRNFDLNRLPTDTHRFLRADVLKFIETEVSAAVHRYDLIILDPPTFSNSKKMQTTFDVQRDQLMLIKKVGKLLLPGGTLYFSTNKRTFRLDKAALGKLFVIKDISLATIPKDFKDNKIHKCFCLERQ